MVGRLFCKQKVIVQFYLSPMKEERGLRPLSKQRLKTKDKNKRYTGSALTGIVTSALTSLVGV